MTDYRRIKNKAHLLEFDQSRDLATCGKPLTMERATRFAPEGAHDPTASFYFVLEDLFSQMEFDGRSWLLDVGCSAGRTLAYFVEAEMPGRATGIELDPELAQYAQSWTKDFAQLDVIQGSALDLPLKRFTHFYLFNPFDTNILLQFITRVEEDLAHPVTFCHMSDNGETYYYWGRPGWSQLSEGSFEYCGSVPAYQCPQHYTIWRYDPAAR